MDRGREVGRKGESTDVDRGGGGSGGRIEGQSKGGREEVREGGSRETLPHIQLIECSLKESTNTIGRVFHVKA